MWVDARQLAELGHPCLSQEWPEWILQHPSGPACGCAATAATQGRAMLDRDYTALRQVSEASKLVVFSV